jgi:hypothetical protein
MRLPESAGAANLGRLRKALMWSKDAHSDHRMSGKGRVRSLLKALRAGVRSLRYGEGTLSFHDALALMEQGVDADTVVESVLSGGPGVLANIR